MQEDMFEKELTLEEEFRTLAMRNLESTLTKSIAMGEASNTAIGKGLIDHVYDNYTSNLKIWLDYQLQPKRGVQATYKPIVQWLAKVYKDKERDLLALLALSTLSVTLNYVCKGASTLGNLAIRIGRTIISEAKVEEFMQTHDRGITALLEKGIKERKSEHYRRYYALQFMQKCKDTSDVWYRDEDISKFGGQLIDVCLSSCDLFYVHDDTDAHGNLPSEIRPTQALIDTWKQNQDMLLSYAHHAHPMIIPPEDWTSYTHGGYVGENSPYYKLLRLHEQMLGGRMNIFTKQYLEKLSNADLSSVMTAINSIQKTPWKIDTKVLEIAKQVMALGGGRAGIPSLDPLPLLPELHNPTPEQLKEHKKKLQSIYKKEASRQGKALRTVATVKTAERFAGYERIYFPCNMDFRGRVYPIPSFSFQGDDLTKGLIQFADTPPIQDSQAERWFLIAGAEFAGIDKVPFDECVKWVKDNHVNIMGTATDPMGMLDWWGELDAPWEFLQFAFEYAKLQQYKKEHYGSSKGWTTGVPVAFDGTCSGLQHFSAILRDPVGAHEVNLKPSDHPQDIYGRVAVLVNKVLEEDAKHGTVDEYDNAKKRTVLGTKTLAQLWLAYGVNRKVTKRSVMTLAYGSKQYGFRDQVLEDTINPHLDEGVFTRENSYALAGYMAKLIWEAVGQVVVKAVEGMAWLQQASRTVTKTGHVISWMTPMGLPVQQHYLTYAIECYKMRFQRTQKRFYVSKETGDVDDRKQASGVAPNFIHSMDASHLQYSVLTAHNKGINHFAMIHDSYGTTVADADKLFHTVRECFVDMYEKHDVLQEFADAISISLPEGIKLPPLPSKGEFDVREVLDSLYAFH